MKHGAVERVGEDTVNYPELDTLKLERRGPVGWLLNNRPDQLNAMNAHMRDEFEIAWRALDADPEVRVIVHTGEGRAFQTGVDVTEIATDGEGMQRYRESVEKFDFHFTAWHNEVWKPVITAVNGICAGGGFHWIADSDIVIAASDAQFFDPHVSIGQVVSIEAIGLMKRMPVEAVMRMAFVGRHERMSAQRAYELGMISEVVDPPERLRDAAQELAEKIARNSPAAMAATKRALWGALELGLTDACRAGARRARVDVGPPRSGGGAARVRREARAAVAAARTHERHRDRRRDRHRDHRLHRAARGPGRRRSTVGTSATTCTPRPPPARARSRARAGSRRARARRCVRRARRGSAIPRAARSSRPCGCSTGRQPEWDAWVGRQMEDLRAEADRMFAGRDHLHTAVYRFARRGARRRRHRRPRPRSTTRSRV